MGHRYRLVPEKDFNDYISSDEYNLNMSQYKCIGSISSNFREYADVKKDAKKYNYPWSIYAGHGETVFQNKKLLILTIAKLYNEGVTPWKPNDKTKDGWTVDKSVYLYHLNNLYESLLGHDDDLIVMSDNL